MNALRKASHWATAHWSNLLVVGVLCLPSVWAILYLCGVVARGPM